MNRADAGTPTSPIMDMHTERIQDDKQALMTKSLSLPTPIISWVMRLNKYGFNTH